jgi:glutamate racemase
MNRSNPIGVMDSGIGGLSTLSGLAKTLPKERFIYIGDNARFPYGNKDPERIKQYGLELAEFLTKSGVKAIVIACNTLSSYLTKKIAREFHLPTFGVVEPTVRELGKHKDITTVVWATPSTINSESYQRRLHKRKKVKYESHPNLAMEIENEQVAQTPPINGEILVLGCTHYSWLTNKRAIVIDSINELGYEVKARLWDNNLLAKEMAGVSTFYFTGDIKKPKWRLSKLFGEKTRVEHINLKEAINVFGHRKA